jgi:hypothetical protein
VPVSQGSTPLGGESSKVTGIIKIVARRKDDSYWSEEEPSDCGGCNRQCFMMYQLIYDLCQCIDFFPRFTENVYVILFFELVMMCFIFGGEYANNMLRNSWTRGTIIRYPSIVSSASRLFLLDQSTVAPKNPVRLYTDCQVLLTKCYYSPSLSSDNPQTHGIISGPLSLIRIRGYDNTDNRPSQKKLKFQLFIFGSWPARLGQTFPQTVAETESIRRDSQRVS